MVRHQEELDNGEKGKLGVSPSFLNLGDLEARELSINNMKYQWQRDDWSGHTSQEMGLEAGI